MAGILCKPSKNLKLRRKWRVKLAYYNIQSNLPSICQTKAKITKTIAALKVCLLFIVLRNLAPAAADPETIAKLI